MSARFWQLSARPMGVIYDDLDYVTNGWSFAKTGQDLHQQTSWWKLQPIKTGAFTSEIGAQWHMPTGLVDWDNPVFGARVTSAVAGLATTILIGIAMALLFRRRDIATVTTSFLLITPWAIILSRSPIDATIGIFWQSLGLVAFLLLIRAKHKKQLLFALVLAICSYTAAFYSYHAYKFSVLVTIGILFSTP